MAAAVVLPLAGAFAGQVGEPAGHAGAERPRGAVRDPGHEDAKIPSLGPAPRLLGLGLATAARCGPVLTSPDGIEAQTCVLTEGADTWARTYYRNATGKSLDSVLSLMGPGGRSLQMRCVTSADDEPATCETPREHSLGGADAYTAVIEFAKRGADGALLLRSGSDQSDVGSGSQSPNSQSSKGS